MLRAMEKGYKTRFAPSPTGLLHLGHVYSAKIAQAFAVQSHGEYIVRVEDIDHTRCQPHFTAQILDDLNWLGLASQQAVICQSNRMDAYERATKELIAQELLYPCNLTRKEVQETLIGSQVAVSPLCHQAYPRTCYNQRKKSELFEPSNKYAWRLNSAKVSERFPILSYREVGVGEVQFLVKELGNLVIVRKEFPTSYHLSVVIDDAWQGINLVTRGADLITSTPVQVTLQHLLGLPTPKYYHHDLLKDNQGEKLAKKKLSDSIKELRDSLVSLEEVNEMLPSVPFLD